MSKHLKGSRFQRAALLGVVCVAAALAVLAFQKPVDNTAELDRLDRVENSVLQVSGLASQVQALEGRDQSVEAQIGELNAGIAGLSASIDELSKKVASSSGADAELAKKIDAVSGQIGGLSTKVGAVEKKMTSVEQKVSLLETRYNDHLRKYHNGG